MKTLTKEMVTFTVELEDEIIPIEKALSVKETGADHSEYISKVLNNEGVNPWLWSCVKVSAKFAGLTGIAYLGQCAYESEHQFKKGGYYEQMQDEAFEDLKIQVNEIISALK